MSKRKTLPLIALIISLLVTLILATVATYAWFTDNHAVDTTRAAAKTDSSKLELAIAGSAGELAAGKQVQECAITPVNAVAKDLKNGSVVLLPVSTADLKTFVYNQTPTKFPPIDVDGDTARDKRLYHGVVYLEAIGENQPDGASMDVYFDSATDLGSKLVASTGGDFIKAARLGLTFDGNNPRIFNLDGNGSPVRNASGGLAADPSTTLDRFTVNSDDLSNRPETPLINLPLNQVCKVDVYFYLEGEDPDCVEKIDSKHAAAGDGADLFLAFYGILNSGANN